MNTKNLKLYALIAAVCCINSLFSANVAWTWVGGASGTGNQTNWQIKSNWTTTDGDAAIGVGDTAVIPAGRTFYPNFVTGSTLSISRVRMHGGTFGINTNDLTLVNGLLMTAGTITLTSGGALNITGGGIVMTGGTLNASPGDITVNAGGLIMSNAAAFNITTGDLDINAGGLSLSNSAAFSSTGTGSIDIGGDLLMTGSSSFSKTSTGNVLVSLDLDINTSGTFNPGTSTLTVGSDIFMRNGTFTKSSGDITITNAHLNIIGGSFSHAANTLTVGNAAGAQNFLMTGGSFTKAAGTMTVDNDLSISSGTFNYGSTASNLTITTGDLLLSGTGILNLNNAGSTIFVNGDDMVMTGGTVGNTGTIDVDDEIAISGGTFNSGAASDIVSGNEINVTGGSTLNLGATITAAVSMEFDGASVVGGSASIVTGNGNTGTITMTNSTVSLGTSLQTNVLIINSGTITGGTSVLDINNTMTVNGGTITKSTGTFAVTNALTVSGGTLTKSGASAVTAGSLVISSGTLNAGTNSWTVTNLTVSGSGILNVESASMNVGTTVAVSGGTVNGGTGNIGSATTDAFNVSGGTVNATGANMTSISFTLTAGTVNAAGNKVLLISGSGGILTINGGTLNITLANLFVEEHMIMQAGTLDLNSLNVTIEDNYTYRGGTISNPGDFTVQGNFTVNHTGTHTMTYDLTVSGLVTFTTGILKTSDVNMLIFGAGATVSGATNARHVWGPVRKIGNTAAFTFPTGDGAIYASIRIQTLTGGNAADYFTATYYNDRHTNAGGTVTGGLDHVSQAEYWILDRSGAVSAFVELSYDNTRSGSITSATNLQVARWTGTQWANHGRNSGGSSTGTTNGVVLSLATVGSFSPFTIGSLTGAGGNPLPVTLLSFDAKPVDKQVKVSWSTTSEINNDFFTVQKCLDGKSWSVMGIVKGVGNSDQVSDYSFMDRNPVNGVQFYRLIQTDLNGKSTISKVITINFVPGSIQPTTINIFPNPSNNIVNINMSASVSDASIVVINSMGMKVMEINGQSGASFVLDMASLATGVYTIEVRLENGVTISKILKL